MSLYASLSDLELVRLLQKGHEEAFAVIYRRHAGKLISFASARLYSQEDARDLIHDVFVRLWGEKEKLQIDRNLESFLFTLLRHRIIDQVRRNISREVYTEAVQRLKAKLESGIEQQIAAMELQQAINRSLGELSPRLQQVFRLSREENLSIREIAKKLQLSEQTVKNQLSATLKHIRQSLTAISVAAFILWLA